MKTDRLVYICSPYHAESKEELERNIRYARELTREVILRGDIPITPHLYITQVLNDNSSRERNIGISAALKLLEKCDYILVGSRYGISGGMSGEIKRAGELDIQTEYV